MKQEKEFARNRLMALCSRREISSAQAREKLLKMLPDATAKEADEIVGSLKAAGYIDDARFAGAFTRDRLRFSKWGPQKILKGLSDAGVEKTIAEQAVEAEETLALKVLSDLLSKKRKELETRQEKKVAEYKTKLEALQRELSSIQQGDFRQKASLQRKIYALQMKMRMGALQVREALAAYARTKGFPTELIDRCGIK